MTLFESDKRRAAAPALLVAVALVWGAAATMLPVAHAGKAEFTTVSGVVRKAEIGTRGEILRVYVDGEDENLLISRREKGKELLAHVGETVEVSGYVRKTWNDENFPELMDVTEFKLVPRETTASVQD